MELKVRGMSYGLLLSHTFPGLVLEVEVILGFCFFTDVDLSIFSFLFGDNSGAYSTLRPVAIIIGMFIVATLLGIVIDGVHHWIYERRERSEDYEVYKHIKTVEQMQIYIHFVEDDLWYYCEAYANMGIAMVPGFFLLAYWLIWCLHPHWFFSAIILTVYLFLLVITFIEVVATKREVDETEKSLIKNFETPAVPKPNASE